MDEGRKKPAARENGSERAFLSGVGVLTAATVVSKIIGLFYRIPLVATVGIAGMAYFLAANHIYVTLYLIASAGLPLAVSILVSERRAVGDEWGAGRVFRRALLLFFGLGVLGSLLLFFGADRISDGIGIPDASPSLRVIAPTMLFASVASAIRGYFQGLGRMAPTAVSEVIESLSKLVFGLGLARLAVLRELDRSMTAAFAAAGLTVGAFLSMLLLLSMLLRETKRSEHERSVTDPHASSVGRILRLAAPVTVSSLVISVASVVDTLLISSRLSDAGFSSEVAESMYSSYGNLALPLFNLPAACITPVSLALVPLLSSAFRSGKREEERKVIASAMRLTALLSIPASMGLSIFSEPILTLLYPDERTAVAVAAPLLSVLAVSVLFSAFMTVTNAILSAYGHPARALFSMSVGASVKILSEYFLVGDPETNIYGAPVSTLLCNVAVTVMNLYFVSRYSAGNEPISSVFTRPFLSSAGSVGGGAILYVLLLSAGGFSPWKVLISIAVTAVAYLFLSVKSGALRPSDLSALPMGDRITRLLFRERVTSHGAPLRGG